MVDITVHKITVIGYYDHDNAGDDQYKYSMTYFLNSMYPKASVRFLDLDKILNEIINPDELIVFGGGDVLTAYFVENLYTKFKDLNNVIIAVSVGIPFVSEIMDLHEKLSRISHFYIRTKQDLERLSYVFPERVSYFPDTSCMLGSYISGIERQNTFDGHIYNKLYKIKRKLVYVCLNKNPGIMSAEENDLIMSMTYVVSDLINQKNCHVVFIPFDKLRDNTIHVPIINNLSSNVAMNTTLITDISTIELFKIFKLANLVISAKYHACLFAVHNYVPFIPLNTTRKIINLIKDLDNGYNILWTDDNQFVNDQDQNQVMLEHNITTDSSSIMNIIHKIDCYHEDMSKKLAKYSIESTYILKNYKLNYKPTWGPSDIFGRINRSKEAAERYINDHLDNFSSGNQDSKITCAKIVSCTLIDCINSPYVYGISEKIGIDSSLMNNLSSINGYSYIKEWSWIIKDYILNDKNNLLKDNPNGLFNMSYIDQIDNSGAHRSGWQYVYSNISSLNNSKAIMLDLYVDRTFHWERDTLSYSGVIPYRKPWVGVIHHTFEESFGSYNNTVLFENDLFIKSLDTCKGIIVLSEYLKKQVMMHPLIKLKKTKVFVLTHPTEIPTNNLFTMKLFEDNPDKKIINIGGWLRNIWAFYKCKIPKDITYNNWIYDKTWPIKKAAIKGYAMNNYFPEPDFLEDLEHFLSCMCNYDNDSHVHKHCSCSNNNSDKNCSNNSSDKNCSNGGDKNCSKNCSCSNIPNIWNRHFFQDVKTLVDNVEIIEKVSNAEYDLLLSKNIVFLNLIDASAVNTLIECIVRNVPVVVNKIPPVVELLGEGYPLYYNNDIQLNVSNLVTYKEIKKAYIYMSKLDKDKFKIQTFLEDLKKVYYTVNT
jgi:hypothetical protein